MNRFDRIANRVLAIEFPSQDALEKYLSEHPLANSSNHTVKRTEGDRERERVYDIHHASKKTICGYDWYGPYTPDHVKHGPPHIERESGVFEVYFREESIDDALVKKLNELVGSDLWDLSAEVEWKGSMENSLETGYTDDYSITWYKIRDAWLDVQNKGKMPLPRSMWRELEGDKLEEALRENFQENIGRGRDIEARETKIARKLGGTR